MIAAGRAVRRPSRHNYRDKDMSTKKYKSSSHVSLSVMLAIGKSVHVTFTPQTGGGSVLYTADERLQRGLERHPRYGKLFRLVEESPRSNVARVAAANAGRAERQAGADQVAADCAPDGTEAAAKKRVVKVTCIDDAKEWLVDKYGLSRTKLRSKKSILEAAESRGVEFQGI